MNKRRAGLLQRATLVSPHERTRDPSASRQAEKGPFGVPVPPPRLAAKQQIRAGRRPEREAVRKETCVQSASLNSGQFSDNFSLFSIGQPTPSNRTVRFTTGPGTKSVNTLSLPFDNSTSDVKKRPGNATKAVPRINRDRTPESRTQHHSFVRQLLGATRSLTSLSEFNREFRDSSPFLAAFREGLARTGAHGAGVLLAVSGGADSMAMLAGLQMIATQFEIPRIAVAHLNHGLRGHESDLDACFVEQICAASGIHCVIEAVPANVLKGRAEGSLEESARTARYEFLSRTARDLQLPIIATAHHQQDQTETLLFNLLRGTGLRGLRGIPSVRSLSEQTRIIRPLLRIARSTILGFVHAEEVEFREDATNEAGEFARNRIRSLMKSLPGALASQLETQLLSLSRQAEATADALDAVADRILESSLLESGVSVARLDRTELQVWSEPLVRHALILLWTRQQWPRQRMNAAHWLRLSEAALTGSPQRWSFPGGVRLSVTRSLLRLERIDSAITPAH